MTARAVILTKILVVLLPIFVAGIIWLAVIAPLTIYRGELDDELDAKRDVLKRYRGLIEQREPSGSDAARVNEEKALQELFFTVPNTNAGAALLQQKLSEIITAGRGQMRSARVEAKPKVGPLEPFAVSITFATSTAGLSRFLQQVEAQKPLLMIEALTVRGGPGLARVQETGPSPNQAAPGPEDPVLDVSVTVSGFPHPKG